MPVLPVTRLTTAQGISTVPQPTIGSISRTAIPAATPHELSTPIISSPMASSVNVISIIRP